MDASTITIISIVAGLAVGAIGGLVLARALSMKGGLLIAGVIVVGAAGGALGWFFADHDLVPNQKYANARKDAERLPEVATLKQYYPADYAKMQNDMEMMKGKRLGSTGIAQLVHANARAVLSREMKKASDENLIALMKIRRDKAEALGKVSPAYCYNFTRGARLDFDPDTVVSADLVQRERAATAAILEQVATNPVKDAAGANLNPEDGGKLVDLWYDVQMKNKIGDQALAGFTPDDAKTVRQLTGRNISVSDPKRQALLCRYNIALLDETLKLPPAKAATVARLNVGKGL
ncbi:hypothetical protein [Caulobacter sp. NIBR1757]|uniref:hypothetical protein n=1 Tax=Caulobacter sp. NIBR1757 TaxID=3016000 RepID=UPI0022F08CB9|nr:hypothetical protein [Caulobacter sp. NIBR1757]WGM39745.1 hypothetical protein AMEJIAPC_02672 [Caulobacter sp. NIBR1757]